MGRQLMLWETKVVVTGGGEARVVAERPVVEGNVDEARKILGGMGAVSRYDVYDLIEEGLIKAWKMKPGAVRRDGRKGNTKWVIDLESVVAHRETMRRAGGAPAERARQNCMEF